MKTVSSSFALITDDEYELISYELKAKMMIAIRDLIESKGWSQKDSAERLGVTQPRISNLVNGKIDKFSLDMLIGMLSKLGVRFEFNYTPIQISIPDIRASLDAAVTA
jgi:predicted XRE-type DNA-binding protein